MNGAALASSISYTTGATVMAVLFARETGVPLRRLIPGPGDLIAVGRRAGAWARTI
jgi:hypothetical protein